MVTVKNIPAVRGFVRADCKVAFTQLFTQLLCRIGRDATVSIYGRPPHAVAGPRWLRRCP